jgi:hypothetical protein
MNIIIQQDMTAALRSGRHRPAEPNPMSMRDHLDRLPRKYDGKLAQQSEIEF